MSSNDVQDQRRWELFRDHLKQDWDDIQSSTDSFDQSLLTLSTGALALSIAFIKDIVPIDTAVWMNLLYASWCLFIVCILVTVISFQLSIAAAQEHLRFLPKFYFEEVKQENNSYRRRLELTTRISSAAFTLGLFCIMLFGIKNTARAHMSEKIGDLKGGRAPISATKIPAATEERGRAPIEATQLPQTPIQEGRQPMNATPVPKSSVTDGRAPLNVTSVPGLEKGRTPIQTTPVPSPAAPAAPQKPAGDSSATNKK